MNFHLFLDRSIIELHLNDRHVVTRRVFPSDTENKWVRMKVRGDSSAKVHFAELSVWKMGSIWAKADGDPT